MANHKVDFLEIKMDKQGTKFINPSESAFAGKAIFVNGGIEQPFASQFGSLAIALVFVDVGNEVMIEADFACLTGIEAAVGIEGWVESELHWHLYRHRQSYTPW